MRDDYLDRLLSVAILLNCRNIYSKGWMGTRATTEADESPEKRFNTPMQSLLTVGLPHVCWPLISMGPRSMVLCKTVLNWGMMALGQTTVSCIKSRSTTGLESGPPPSWMSTVINQQIDDTMPIKILLRHIVVLSGEHPKGREQAWKHAILSCADWEDGIGTVWI